MKISKFFPSISLILLIVLIFSGCGSVKKTGTPPPLLSGYVTNGRSGPGIAGAGVEIYRNEVLQNSLVTDSSGKFSLENLPNGTVDLVASKPGYAGVRYQNILISAGKPVTANLIMKQVFDSSLPVTPPVAEITGISPEETLSGSLNITVSLTGAQDPSYGHAYLGFGIEDTVNSLTGYPFSINLDTSTAPDGPTFCYIVAYDINNNCVITKIPVTVENNGGETSLAMTKPVTALAITEGYNMQYDSFNQLKTGIKINSQKMLNVLQNSIHVQGAAPDTDCFVGLTWESEFSNDNFSCYKVYRGKSAAGPWKYLCFSLYDPEDDSFYTFDSSPEVTPNVYSYYKVVPVNKSGREGSGKTVGVKPLGRCEVNLEAPAHNSTGVTLPPTFRWNCNLTGVDLYYFEMTLNSLSTSEPGYLEFFCTPSTTFSRVFAGGEWGFSLNRNCQYQWDIVSAIAQKIYSNYSEALSFGMKGYSQGSSNGAFLFTTAP